MRARILLLTPLATLLGCSPEVSFHVPISVEGVEAPKRDRLHMAVTFDPSKPVEAPWADPYTPSMIEPNVAGDSLDVMLSGRGRRVTLDARFWYDVDGDGVPSATDRVGRLDFPVTGEDHGLLCGNLTEIDAVTLAAKPSGTSVKEEPKP